MATAATAEKRRVAGTAAAWPKKCGRQITKPIGKCRPPFNSGLSPGFPYARAIAEAFFRLTAIARLVRAPLSDMIFMFIVFHLHLAFGLGDGMTHTLFF